MKQYKDMKWYLFIIVKCIFQLDICINKLFLPVIVALLIDGWLHIGDLLLKRKWKKVLA